MPTTSEDRTHRNTLTLEWEKCFATAQKYQHELMQAMHELNSEEAGQSLSLEQINKAIALWLLEKEAKAALDAFVPTPAV